MPLDEQASRQSDQRIPLKPSPNPSVAVFRSSTIAPSPDASQSPNFDTLTVDTMIDSDPTARSSPLSAALRIQTDMRPTVVRRISRDDNRRRISGEHGFPEPSRQKSLPLGRTPSIKSILGQSHGSVGSAASSAFSSPMLNAMADITPLPSPLLSSDSPGPWRKLGSRPTSQGPALISENSALVAANGEPIASAIANQMKRKAFVGLGLAATPTEPSPIIDESTEHRRNLEVMHVRNRSLSEYIPDPLVVPKQGVISVSGSHVPVLDSTPETPLTANSLLHREPHLAVQRGLAPVHIVKPPTPPSSRTGGESSDSDSSASAFGQLRVTKKPRYEYYDAYTRNDSKRRRWRKLKDLGQGTFSTVVLATSQLPVPCDRIDEHNVFGVVEGIPTSSDDATCRLAPSPKSLVAIKICEHGPKGGASEERIEMSLKRELEILKSISHPSIVHLKAWHIEPTRAILVLSYCAGGDLFDLASQHQAALSSVLLQRIFAELVGAVRYLHSCHIVHRDIKLESAYTYILACAVTDRVRCSCQYAVRQDCFQAS